MTLLPGGWEGKPVRLADRPALRLVADRAADIAEADKHPDSAASQRAVAAMMTMKKLDIAAMQRAYDGAG